MTDTDDDQDKLRALRTARLGPPVRSDTDRERLVSLLLRWNQLQDDLAGVHKQMLALQESRDEAVRDNTDTVLYGIGRYWRMDPDAIKESLK